jgi:hypothetical protein
VTNGTERNAVPPELLLVSELGPDHPLMHSLVSQLLEKGIYFEFDRHQDLPARLPDDLGPYRAILLDPLASARVAEEPDALQRLDEYVRRDGFLFHVKRLPELEQLGGYYTNLFYDLHTYHLATYVIAHAGLTPFHPALERIQLRRPEEEILASLKAIVLDNLASMDHWGEYTMHYWKAAVALIQIDGQPDVHEALVASIRRMCRNMPLGYVGDHISGLFGTVWLYEQTGEREPLERAIQVVERVIACRPRTMGVLNFGGLVDDPLALQLHRASGDLAADWGVGSTAQRAVNWNEALHMQCGTLAAMTAATGDRRYLEEALDLIRHCGQHHLAQDRVLYHASRDGVPVAHKWGRGQTHALYGMIYTLDQMRPSDPARQEILDLVQEIGLGLVQVQDPLTGLWRNDVAMPEARLESSCTAGIVYVYGRCMREGWLDRALFEDMVLRGWGGLKRMFWRGGLTTQCRGTAIGDVAYYMSRPHGWAVVPQMAMALLEVRRLMDT